MEKESSCSKIHGNYSKEIQKISKEKEIKLRETNKKYDFALYNVYNLWT